MRKIGGCDRRPHLPSSGCTGRGQLRLFLFLSASYRNWPAFFRASKRSALAGSWRAASRAACATSHSCSSVFCFIVAMGDHNGGWAGASTQVKLVPGKSPETKITLRVNRATRCSRFDAARTTACKTAPGGVTRNKRRVVVRTKRCIDACQALRGGFGAFALALQIGRASCRERVLMPV